jgi:hypothetical protein
MIQDIHQEILKSYRELREKKILRVNATQLKLWSECREKHRIEYLLGKSAVEPSIHYHFGSVIHKMAEGYWSGKPYMESFHAALKLAQELDIRLLNAKDQSKWSALQDAIAPITTIYYGYHGDKASLEPPILNERTIEWPWGEYAGIKVICNGIIDRLSHGNKLVDTKTASAVGTNWKSDLKKRLLREPQMGFYLRYLERDWFRKLQMGVGTEALGKVEKIEYEIIVKPYRGSDPRIETIDVTDEVMAFQPVFIQQMDWAIREMVEFYTKCADAEPWPMSNTACVSMWGECDYLPVCSGKTGLDNEKLYKIKDAREVEV